MTVATACWCGETATAEHYHGPWQGGGQDIQVRLGRCTACGTVRTLWHDGPQVDYTTDGDLYTELSHRHQRSLRTISQHLRPGPLLEIGCNSGLMLDAIARRHQRVRPLLGIDLNTAATTANLFPGVTVKAMRLDQVSGTFANILGLHVFEHIPDLAGFCRDLRRVCTVGTMLYLAVPNIEARNYRVGPDRWGPLNPPQHLWHFSKQTLRAAVHRLLPDARLVTLTDSAIKPLKWVLNEPMVTDDLRDRLDSTLQGDQVEAVFEIV